MRTIKLLENGEPAISWPATRKPESRESIVTPHSWRDEVALLAYHIYLEQGSPQGRDVEHWREAETQMQSQRSPNMNASLEGQGVAAAVTPVPHRADAPQRILVVEDDRDICDLSIGALVRSGYRVDAAEDGAAGWEALLTHSYDLLITDNKMPKVSGVELVEKLRSVRMTLPVVLASSIIPMEELARKPSLRLAATLPKPFTTDELLRTVREVLRAPDSPDRRNGTLVLAADRKTGAEVVPQ